MVWWGLMFKGIKVKFTCSWTGGEKWFVYVTLWYTLGKEPERRSMLQGSTAADHWICGDFVTGFHSCRSLNLRRCILQGSTAPDHWICCDFVTGFHSCRSLNLRRCTCMLQGSTAAITEFVAMCVTGFHSCQSLNLRRLCYRVPQLPITEFAAIMLQGSTAADHWICGMYMVPQLQITAFVTQVFHVWSKEGKLDSESAFKLYNIDFILRASGSSCP
jgi:hypothetical protein